MNVKSIPLVNKADKKRQANKESKLQANKQTQTQEKIHRTTDRFSQQTKAISERGETQTQQKKEAEGKKRRVGGKGKTGRVESEHTTSTRPKSSVADSLD